MSELNEYSYSHIKQNINYLLSNRSSFVIVGVGGKILEATKMLENAIESRGMSCRVYTRNRSVAATAAVWSPFGILSLAGIAAHNLATYNPDYEIGKAVVDHKIYVEYKK